MDLNSKSFNCSIFNLGAQYYVLLERMFGACMLHDMSMHQIFRALRNNFASIVYFCVYPVFH